MSNREWWAKVVTRVNRNWVIGPSGRTRNGLYRRGTKSCCNFSWISWRSSSSPLLGLPQPPVFSFSPPRSFVSVYPPSPTSLFPPFALAVCSRHPHEDRRLVRRHDSNRLSQNWSLQAGALDAFCAFHWVLVLIQHHTSASAPPPARVCPSFASLFLLSLFFLFPRVLSAFFVYVSSVCLVLSLFLLFRVAIGLFPWRSTVSSPKNHGQSFSLMPLMIAISQVKCDTNNFSNHDVSRARHKLLALDNACSWRVLSIFKRRQQIIVHFPCGYIEEWR